MIDGSSRHHLYLLTGTFFNPGPYAAYIMLGLVMAVALYNDSGNGNDNYPHSTLNRLLGATWSIVTILLLAAILPATLSRSAMLSAATVLILIYRRRLGRKIWHLITLLAVIGIAAYFMKRGSADGRGMIYYISLLCLAGRPLFGSGIGSFFHQYAETTAALAERGNVMLYNVDVIDYSFNSLLHIGVEQGLIGMGREIVVGIDKRDIVALSDVESGITGCTQTTVGLVDDEDACFAQLPRIAELRTGIGRTVIDEDDLEAVDSL